MSYFIIWICYNLKLECVKDDLDNAISFSLLIRENNHKDIWTKIRLKPIHLKKLVKLSKVSLELIKEKKVDI